MAVKKPGPKAMLSEEDVALLYEVSTSIHAIRDLDEMLQSILHNIKAVFHVEGASIALHDAERSEFYFIRTVEEEKHGRYERKRQMRFPDHVGVAGWVFREKRPALIPDAAKDDRFFKGMDLREEFVTRSMICVPLLTRGGFLGVLYALNKLEGEFCERDVRLLEILSGTIAVAIENAQFCGELKRYANSLEKQNLRLRSEVQGPYKYKEIVGSSSAIRRLFLLLEKVIETDTTVLIQGETGTGKELVAKVIHHNGPRKDRPFVAENCGALAEQLLESELFGHVKGAFTGAICNKKGLFELADGGTVFLDEIGEMSPSMQVKLLRVLQEGQIRPVGGSLVRNVDLRLIAATNRDLEEEVKRRAFRKDLFYRICVFPIVVPTLRERSEDIPLLADYFLRRFVKKHKAREARFTPQALDLLSRYDWPGNVRELENEMERALTLAGGQDEIREEHLSEKVRTGAVRVPAADGMHGTLQEVTLQIEQRMILETLRNTGGNRSQAAKLLGLTRQGLLNKIARYGIQL
jgi:Nif-specific regulatory protein